MAKGSIGVSQTVHSCMTKDRKEAIQYKGNQKNKKANICLKCPDNDEGYCKKHASKCYIANRLCEKTKAIKLHKPSTSKKKYSSNSKERTKKENTEYTHYKEKKKKTIKAKTKKMTKAERLKSFKEGLIDRTFL